MNKYIVIVYAIALSIPISIQARVDISCKVSYQTKKGWSEQVLTDVAFMGGNELASKTGNAMYSNDENYLLVWFKDGEVAISKLIGTSGHLIRIGSIEKRHVITMFNTKYDFDAIQVNSSSAVKWNVECKDTWFYDKRFR